MMSKQRKFLWFIVLGGFLVIAVSIYAGGTIDLPKTGQTGCWDKDGNPVTCAGTGQDGDKLAGADWPAQRFTNNGNGTITDNLTGLMWSQDAKSPKGTTACTPAGNSKTWTVALTHVKCLRDNGFLGYYDWRLPNTLELTSLFNSQETNVATWLQNQGFINTLNTSDSYWWVATTYAEQPSKAWIAGTKAGKTTASIGSGDTKDNKYYYVWPVRGGN